jgi:hypothetical protein
LRDYLTATESEFVIKGTGIDFGYLAIIVGIIVLIFNSKRAPKKNDEEADGGNGKAV